MGWLKGARAASQAFKRGSDLFECLLIALSSCVNNGCLLCSNRKQVLQLLALYPDTEDGALVEGCDAQVLFDGRRGTHLRSQNKQDHLCCPDGLPQLFLLRLWPRVLP